MIHVGDPLPPVGVMPRWWDYEQAKQDYETLGRMDDWRWLSRLNRLLVLAIEECESNDEPRWARHLRKEKKELNERTKTLRTEADHRWQRDYRTTARRRSQR